MSTPRYRVVELCSWLVHPKTRPQVISNNPLPSPKKRKTSSPRANNLSPRIKQQTPPTPRQNLATSIAICHQINSLFRAQASFLEAELLATEFYKHTALTTAATPKKQLPEVALIEVLLDVLEAAGTMAHVPIEVLANLALDEGYKLVIRQSEAVGITRALLLAAGSHRKENDTAEDSTLLESIARDFIEDFTEEG